MSKIGRLLSAIFPALMAVGCGEAQATAALKNATVLIIRHAEKPDTGRDLSPPGLKRAQAYVQFFKSFTIDSHPVRIDHLVAAAGSKNSDRPHETLEPLSKALGLKIHSEYNLDEAEKLAAKVRRSYGGETVVVCWHHGAIPDLLKAFRVDPKAVLPGGKWPDDVFGWLIVLQYDQSGKPVAHVYNESLTPEDAKHPPPLR